MNDKASTTAFYRLGEWQIREQPDLSLDKLGIAYRNNSASFLADKDGTSMNFESFKNAIKEYNESFPVEAVVRVNFADIIGLFENCKRKISLYNRENGGEYIGGVEAGELLKRINNMQQELKEKSKISA